MSSEKKIMEQCDKIKNDHSKVVLFAPCRIDEGILQLNEDEKKEVITFFKKSNSSPTYFIPASGSGSRMFAFLYDFLTQPEISDFSSIERFMNHLDEFAFFQLLPNELKEKIQNNTLDTEDIAVYLLSEKGLNFENLPKGLIPFHYNEPFVLNPFQEHVLQGTRLSNGNAKFHFTIQNEFEKQIKLSITNLEGITGRKYNVSYSSQSKDSDSFAFDSKVQVVKENGKPILRPSGHGALLDNLNLIDEELIFIKNIDNVQHFNFSNYSMDSWSILGGSLQIFRSKLKKLNEKPSKKGLIELNNEYQFLSPTEINSIKTEKDIINFINRPIRVCGMVRNEGQYGGGPFWIEDNGIVSKQIVEKVQISLYGEQFRLMLKSTHFNPVMIALCPRDLKNKKVDLLKFRDDKKYFIVTKNHKGKKVRFLESPGLWNGGMAHWNTLFIEILQETFSPVKTVLDLLETQHLGK